jgi:CDP-glycerol glycerophosphotransferase (TagB/SpsB family)
MRCRHVFFTHGLYRVPANRRQAVVNLWHGEFTKEIGAWVGTLKVPSSYAVATSKLGVAYRCAEFELPPPRVLIVGNPRNDLLLSTSKADARQQFDLPADRRVLLWLPTYRFRHLRMGPPPTPSASDLATFDAWLEGRQTVLVVKQHPLAGSYDPPSGLRNVRFIADDPDSPTSIAVLMAASDGLITDFSSAWVDYLLLDRPIWIHWPDHDRWSEHGRLQLEPLEAWLPGPLTTDVGQLLEEIESEGRTGVWSQRRTWLRSVLHRYQDSGSTERLLDAIGIGAPARN